jgi:hypothetical protein
MTAPRSTRKVLLFIAEYLIGGGIIYWLLHRNLLDLSPLRSVSLPLVLGGVLLALAMTYLASVRLKYLLRDQGIGISVRRCFFFNCMAIFYSMFLPGGFSGDAARAYYLMREIGHNRAALLGSLLLDRMLGLLAMIGLGTASSAFLVAANPWLMTYLIYLAALFVLGLAFLGYLLIAEHRPDNGGRRNAFMRLYGFVHNLLVRLNIGAHSRETLAYAVGLSIAIHSFSIFLIYVCSVHNDSGLGLLGVFSVGPFGLLANAIPISPGGLGVGEQSFEFLYRLVGGRNGASSFLTARLFLYSPAVVGAAVAAVLFLRLHKAAGLGKRAGK